MNANQYTIKELGVEATEFLQRKKQRNETTYINYKSSINYFIYYLENIADVTVINADNKEKIVESFQGALFEGFTYNDGVTERVVQLKASGVNTNIRRVKTFLNSLGLPVAVIPLKTARPKYKGLELEEIKLLISECFNYWKNEEIAVRNSTLIKFLFNTALRINEALNIKETDVFKDHNCFYVNIHEKGKAKGELTTIAISQATYNSLMDYIKIKKVPSDYVFSTTRASADGKAKALTRQNFNKYVKALAYYVDVKHNTNISKTVENNSSHVFRHSRALYLLKVKNIDVTEVKEILRHQSINSTQLYVAAKDETINQIRTSYDI